MLSSMIRKGIAIVRGMFAFAFACMVAVALFIVITNLVVLISTKSSIISEDNATLTHKSDAILVLGASVYADGGPYANQGYYDLREIPARTKDFIYTLARKTSAILGEPVSLAQSGDVTNDHRI